MVTAETRQVPVRTLPITPTVARVKQELPAGLKTASTAIMSPEMARSVEQRSLSEAGGFNAVFFFQSQDGDWTEQPQFS